MSGRIVERWQSLPLLAAFALLALFPGPLHAAESGIVLARAATAAGTLVGFTRPRRIMDLVSEEEGRCLAVLADVGQAIGADGLFARLDATFLDIALAGNQTEQKRLTNETAYLGREVSRFRTLVTRETAAQASLDELEYKLAQSRFRLEALQVEERNLRERRGRMLVRGRAGWVVVERQVEPGEWVPRSAVLGRAGDFSTLLVPFALAGPELAALKSLPEIVLSLPESGARVPARVERVAPDFDPETRKTLVELAVDGGMGERRGGVRAELTLQLPDPGGAVLVPRSAVVQRYEEYFVEDESGERLRVQFLGEDQGLARVRAAGLAPGRRLRATPAGQPASQVRQPAGQGG